jgi:predicted dehydrogenase
MTAGYVRPGSAREEDSWYLAITGVNGELKIFPSDEGQGRLVLEQGESIHQQHFEGAPNPFELQVKTVVDAIDGDNHCHNTPQTCFMDVAVAEVISQSVQQKQTIELSRWLQSGLHV